MKIIRNLLAASLFAACSAPGILCAAPDAKGGGNSVKLEVFFESMDGSGWQWFFMGDAVRRRLPAVDFKVYPLLTKNSAGEWEAKRGEGEVAESLRIAVVAKLYPEKLPGYLNARSLSPWADGWRDAAIFAGVSPEELERRVSSEGRRIFNSVYEHALKMGVTENALLINGKPYSGGPRVLSLLEAVNGLLPKDKRAALPLTQEPVRKPAGPAPKFWVVLSSGMAKNEALMGAFGKYFEGIKAQTLDYEAARQRKDLPELEFVPAYLLEDTAASASRLEAEIKAGLFVKRNGYLVYFDKQRGGLYTGNKHEPGVLKIFVMSQCPFGVQAENAVLEAMSKKLLPNNMKLELHYIGDADKTPEGAYNFRSLHGTPEWEENVRQLVIARKFPGKLNAYLLARNKDVTSTRWEDAAKQAGLSPAAVTEGFEEGKELLAADFKIAGGMGITTSPSFLWEGRTFVMGLGELAKVPGFEKVSSSGPVSGAGCAK